MDTAMANSSFVVEPTLSEPTLLQHVAQSVSKISTFDILVVLLFIPILRVTYNLYFHPLSKYPGPWYLTGSDIVYAITQLRGTSQYTLRKAHERYGDVVRIAPNTLSFVQGQAWEEIYGYAKGRAVLPKDPLFYNEMLLGRDTITLASDDDAVPIRRAMNTAFAHKNLLDQAPMLQEHMDRLISQLDSESKKLGSKGVDLREWFTMSMFDVNSDFGFGDDLGCVRTGSYHEWVKFVIEYFYAATLIHQCHKFWPLAPLLAMLIPASTREHQKQHNDASLKRVRRRMELDLDRPDFMYHFARHGKKEGLTTECIEAQATVVILAGSETSSVGLTAAVYQTLSKPPVYKKLCSEIRGLFKSPSDVNLPDVLNKLPYLNAVIWESLRIHAPLANGFPRVVPEWKKDYTVCGNHIPPGTVVTINHYAANTLPRNFREPFSFVPERWLGDPEYADDQRDVVQPFSVGPRNCPGRNFALNNMKLAMAHLVMNFDMELGNGLDGWPIGQRIYNGWIQPPLPVVLHKRKA